MAQIETSATEAPTFHSQFGGNWIDASDFADQLAARVADGRLSPELAERVEFFEREGYYIFEGVVSDELIDAIHAEIAGAWEPGSGFLGRNNRDGLKWAHEFPADGARRIVDPIVNAPSAQLAAFVEPVRELLAAVFDEDPLGFQSLYFEQGSQQAMHQDTAYVVASEPVRIAAAWIALEDVAEGHGELMYYPRSHRFPDFVFGSSSEPSKSWNIGRDGREMHQAFLRGLNTQADAAGIETMRFLPKRGDVLLWHADLAHGGTKLTVPDATRRSVVVHYMPVSVKPNYVNFTSHFRPYEVCAGGYISSRHYDPYLLDEEERPVMPVEGLNLNPL